MTATATVNTFWRRSANFVLVEPLRVAWQLAPQTMVTSASVAMNAGFAQSHGILPVEVAVIQAIGFEWTYLRGLASAGKTRSPWVDRLNYGAFVSVVLFGVMYCLVAYKVIPEAPSGLLAFFLACVHVLPVAFVGLCAAMIHRSIAAHEKAEQDKAAERERERAERLRAERDAMDLEAERKRRDLELWAEGVRLKQELRGSGRATKAPSAAPDVQPVCPNCGASLSGVEFGAYKSVLARGATYGGCKACRAP